MMLRLAFLALGLSSFASAQSSSSQGGEVVATVNGTPIYASELPIQTKLASLKRQEYDAKVQAARELAAKKIVEKAAQAKGQTVDQFLAAEVDDKVKDPSDDELKGFYLAKQSEFGGSFESARGQCAAEIFPQLENSSSCGRLWASRFFKAPIFVSYWRPLATTLTLARVHSVEPERLLSLSLSFPISNVPVTSHAYCKGALPVLKQVTEKYGDKVQFMFKDFPLNDIHPQAQAAAEAAHCAEEQGKFWEYHDALFSIAPNFDAAHFMGLATAVGVKDGRGFSRLRGIAQVQGTGRARHFAWPELAGRGWDTDVLHQRHRIERGRAHG